jgi:hypothetical protein
MTSLRKIKTWFLKRNKLIILAGIMLGTAGTRTISSKKDYLCKSKNMGIFIFD